MFCFNLEKMLWRFKKFYPNKVLKYAFLLFDSVKGSQEFFSKSVISLAKTSSRLVHFEFFTSSVQVSHSDVSDYLRPHGLQHARFP